LEVGDAGLLKVSTSQITDFKWCRELHRLRWVQRILPVNYVSEDLQTGTAIHNALESYLWTQTVDAAFDKLEESLDGYALAAAEAMVAGYAARWENEHLEILEVERGFSIVRDGYVLTGKIDAIAKHGDRVVVVEHKTSNREIGPGADYWQGLTIDDQIGIYLPGARSIGYEPEAVIYDVLRKPQIKPKEATPPEKRKFTKAGKLYASQREESEPVNEYRERVVGHMCDHPTEYFARKEIVRLGDEERALRRDLLRIVGELRTTYEDPETPAPKSPHACKRYGRPCEYLDLCAGRDTITSTNWKTEKRHEQTKQNSQRTHRAPVVSTSLWG